VNVAEFAEFWQVQGHRVFATQSCYWYNAGPLAFMSLPHHRLVQPSSMELARVFLKGPAAMIRFPQAVDQKLCHGGIFLCANREYDLSCVKQKARNQTRRGLERCMVQQITFPYLAREGYHLVRETVARQGRNSQGLGETQWARYCAAAARSKGFEGWAAFVGGTLAGFVVAALVEDYYTLLHQSSATKHLSEYVNNALVFVLMKASLSRADVGRVSYGLKSIDQTPGLDQFKVNMGFTLRPTAERVKINPLLRTLLRMGGSSFIQWKTRQLPENDVWRRANRLVELGKV
jgi:hypothetical protein